MKINTRIKTEYQAANERKHISEVAHQVEMALESENTEQGVKDCIETIIFEASNNVGLPLADFSLVRAALPKIIEAMDDIDYGLGIIHSLSAIVRQNTDVYQKYYEARLTEEAADIGTLANLLSKAMKHPKMPKHLYNVLADELTELPDTDTPEIILTNLKSQIEKENE